MSQQTEGYMGGEVPGAAPPLTIDENDPGITMAPDPNSPMPDGVSGVFPQTKFDQYKDFQSKLTQDLFSDVGQDNVAPQLQQPAPQAKPQPQPQAQPQQPAPQPQPQAQPQPAKDFRPETIHELSLIHI